MAYLGFTTGLNNFYIFFSMVYIGLISLLLSYYCLLVQGEGVKSGA